MSLTYSFSLWHFVNTPHRNVRYNDDSYNVKHYWSQWGNSLFTPTPLREVRGQTFIEADSELGACFAQGNFRRISGPPDHGWFVKAPSV